MLFISCYKRFLFSRYLNFCPDLLVMQENGLIRKLRLISKFMTPQTGKQIIPIHVIHNFLRGKDNQTMRLGQLIEYTIRNIFLEKSYTKHGKEASPRSFYEISKLRISLDQYSQISYSLFLLYVQVQVYQKLLTACFDLI